MWLAAIFVGLVLALCVCGYWLAHLLWLFGAAMHGQMADTSLRNLSDTTKLSAVLMVSCLLGSLSISGCSSGSGPSSPNTPKVPTAELIRQQNEEVDAAHAILATGSNSVLKMLDAINAGNVTVQVPLVKARVQEADSHLVSAQADAPKVVKQAEADAGASAQKDAKIKDLEKADPQVAMLNKVGITLLVLSIIAVGLGIWLNIAMARNGGVAGAGVALAILALATYLHAIEWIIGLSAIAVGVGLLVYWLLHRKVQDAQDGHNEFIGALVASALPKIAIPGKVPPDGGVSRSPPPATDAAGGTLTTVGAVPGGVS